MRVVPTNREIVAMLWELAALTTLDEGSPQAFRVRAYENAAHGIEGVGVDVTTLSEADLTKIKGVGASTARKIRELVEKGNVRKLEELRARYPPAFVELARIPGIGPKTLVLMRRELGVENLDDLRMVIAEQRLRELPGLGKTSEEKIAQAIERLGLHGKDRRTPIAEALPVAEALVEELAALAQVKAAAYCGSLRRFSETIGDVDIVVATDQPRAVMDHVAGWAADAQVIGHGETKTSVLTRLGLQVDVRAVRPDQLGAALAYFTGSKAHNIALRQRAIARGWTLNEYGLADAGTGEIIAARTEEDVYRALDVDAIPPELRENAGEVEAAARRELPLLVELSDIRGDLHDHTDQSGDGRASLEEMVAAASERGYQYLAITDHGEDLVVNGQPREVFLVQREQIVALQEAHPETALLHGCELNIGRDGGLDYDPDFRMGFAWCVASVHSHFDLDQARQTERLLRAMADPAVNVIGHLTGRMIGRRPGIELDVEAVLEGAAELGVALEVNGALDRLDASPDVVRRARRHGVTLVISTDSHHPSDLRRMEWGVRNARRGWAEKEMVANTWERRRFLEWAVQRRVSR